MSITANYEFGAIPPDLLSYVKNKSKSAQYYFEYLLIRTKGMFHYKNLPDTIDRSILERLVMVNGICVLTDYEGKLYLFNGSAGGAQDVYYRPTLFVVSNPHLKGEFSKEVVISSQLTNYNESPTDSQPGVLLRNDSEWIGLTPLIARYAVLMAENCVTIRSADIMLRIIALISANNDKALKSAQDYLKKIENGDLGVIGTSQFQSSIDMQSPPSNNGSYLTQFIELHQYLKASYFNEIGLRANYNMKREAIGEGETSLDEEAVLPLCEEMLKTRREDWTKVNEMYGTNVEVDFDSAWLESKLSRNATIVSQLSAAGLAEPEVKENDDERDSGIENSNNKDNGREDGTLSKNSEDGKGEGSSDDGSGRSENQGTGSKESDDGEREELSDNNSETGGSDNGDRRSSLNDITANELLTKAEEIVNQVNLDTPEEKGEEYGFLGETEGTRDKTSATDG